MWKYTKVTPFNCVCTLQRTSDMRWVKIPAVFSINFYKRSHSPIRILSGSPKTLWMLTVSRVRNKSHSTLVILLTVGNFTFQFVQNSEEIRHGEWGAIFRSGSLLPVRLDTRKVLWDCPGGGVWAPLGRSRAVYRSSRGCFCCADRLPIPP